MVRVGLVTRAIAFGTCEECDDPEPPAPSPSRLAPELERVRRERCPRCGGALRRPGSGTGTSPEAIVWADHLICAYCGNACSTGEGREGRYGSTRGGRGWGAPQDHGEEGGEDGPRAR
jgi:hypothetical protein